MADIQAVPPPDAERPGIVEIESYGNRWRIAVRYSETDVDFLWLTRDQLDQVLAAAAPVLRQEGATTERQAIAANLEAEAEIGRHHWEARDALRSFARRLRELGDADLLDGRDG